MQATLTSEGMIDRANLMVPAQTYVAQCFGTFEAFSPRQRAANVTLDRVIEKLDQV